MSSDGFDHVPHTNRNAFLDGFHVSVACVCVCVHSCFQGHYSSYFYSYDFSDLVQ